MKLRVKIINSSLLLLTIFFMLTVILEFRIDKLFGNKISCFLYCHRGFLINIMQNFIYGSPFAILVEIITYNNKKNHCILQFKKAVEKFYSAFDKLQYLYPKVDYKLIVGYFNEKEKNHCCQVNEDFSFKNILECYKKTYEEENEANWHLQNDIKKIENSIDNIVESYRILSLFDFYKVKNTFDDFYFYSRNCKLEIRIKNIYSYCNALYKDITDAYAFLNDDFSNSAKLREIFERQNNIFKLNGIRTDCFEDITFTNVPVEKLKTMLLELW